MIVKSPIAKAVEANPFYGLKHTLSMSKELSKTEGTLNEATINSYITNSWNECKGYKEKRELFFTLIFSLGDIQNREHNLFKKQGVKDIDGGGNSQRKTFIIALQWILRWIPDQFYAFLPIIGEYYNLDGMMFYEIKTDRYKGNIKEILKLEVDMKKVVEYIASVLKSPRTTENEKKLWAKWLWHIPTAKRQKKFVVTEIGLKSVRKKIDPNAKVGDEVKGTREKQQATKAKDTWTLNNIHMLSRLMDWEIKVHAKNREYVGYKKFRSQYLQDTEAAMFSSGKIKELDKTQLFEWFEKLPSSARFRTQTRLVSKDTSGKLSPKDKWISDKDFFIGEVYLDWLKSKEKAQEVIRTMSKEDKEKLAKEDPNKLKQLVKEAKVNTGGETLIDVIAEFFRGVYNRGDVDMKAQALLEKVNLELPVMVIADTSGSMSNNTVQHKDVMFTASRMAQLIVTMFLLKNPDEDLQQMFIRFDSTCDIVTSGQAVQTLGANRFMSTSSTVVKKLVDPKLKFSENFNEVGKYTLTKGQTHFNTVANELKRWVALDESSKSMKIEMINKYPVWLVVSDGDMNNSHDAGSSMREFQMIMKQNFGWEGIVVVWDVKAPNNNRNSFENLENVIYYSGTNPSVLNTIFKNIHDLDVVDVYTPLKSLYSSNRYQPVRTLVL